MLETIRRYSNQITLFLLALSAGVVFNAYHNRPHGKGARNRGGHYLLIGPPSQSYMRGMQAVRNHDTMQAEQEFHRALLEPQRDPRVFLALAELLRTQKHSQEALTYYRMGLGPDSTWGPGKVTYWVGSGLMDPEAALHYAEICEAQGLAKEAEQAYQGVIVFVDHKRFRRLEGPDWEAAHSSKKRAYLAVGYWRDNQGHHTEAVAAYKQAGVHSSS